MNRGVPIVLLLEPEPIQSMTFARVLKDEGYSVIPVSRASDALEIFVSHHTDITVVVVDTQAPAAAGTTLVGALHDIAPQVPVVAMSRPKAMAAGASSASKADRPMVTAALATELSPDRYPNVVATLTKPVAAADLLVHVQHALQCPHLVGTSAFNWPPCEEELDHIQVIDLQAVAFAEPAVTGPAPSLEGGAELAVAAVAAAPFVSVAPFAQADGTMDAAPTDRIVLRAPDTRRAVPRFVSRERWIAVAATAIAGLSLTTLLEFRTSPARQTTSADHAPPRIEVAVLQARGYRLAPTELVPALRARSQIVPPRIPGPVGSDIPRVADALRSSAPLTPVSSRDTVRALTSTRPADLVAASALRAATEVPAATATPALPIVEVSTQASAATLASLSSTLPTHHHVELAEALNTRGRSAPSEIADAPEAGRTREDERGVYEVLRQYRHAYERLDVNAARAVWPSLNTRALARAFGGLKEQSLEFSDCRLAMETRQATAICGGRATFVPRVGPQTARTEPRQWTFRLEKIDADWQIVRAEVK